MGPPVFILQSSHASKTILKVYSSELFSELATILKYNLGLCFFEKTIFHLFFLILEKLRSPARGTYKNPKIFLWIRKNWNLRMNWKKLGPNLSFTVENEASNLHKIKLLLFQTQWMRYSITSKFINLSINWEKYVFYWEKWNFEPIMNMLTIWCFTQAGVKFTFKTMISWGTRSKI